MQCPSCDSQMDVRASFPTNRDTIYTDAICRKCGSVYIGKLEKIEDKNRKYFITIGKGGQYGG